MHGAYSLAGSITVIASFIARFFGLREICVMPLLHELQALRKIIDFQLPELGKQLQHMDDHNRENAQTTRKLQDIIAWQLPELRKHLGLMYEHDRADSAKTIALIEPLTRVLVEQKFMNIAAETARGDF